MIESQTQGHKGRAWRVLSILSTLLLLWWGAWPAYRLYQANQLTLSQKAGTPPSASFLRKVSLYAGVARSPFLRGQGLQKLAVLLREHMYPANVSLSFRGLIMRGNVGDWSARFQAWDEALRQLEESVDGLFDVRHLRAFLYLQSGHWRKMHRWAADLPKSTPTQRSQALFYAWLGHAAFFSGRFELAAQQYDVVIRALDLHPRWDHRHAQNWRVPAEITAVIHHRALIATLQQQKQRALSLWQRQQRRWERHMKRKKGKTSMWYSAHLWAATGARNNKQAPLAVALLKQALRYQGDTTLATLQSASLLRRRDPGKALRMLALLQRPLRQHTRSYFQSAQLAKLMQASTELRQQRMADAQKTLTSLFLHLQKHTWATTLHALQSSKQSRLRVLPTSPSFLRSIQAQIPARANWGVLRQQLAFYSALAQLRLQDWPRAVQALSPFLQAHASDCRPTQAPSTQPTTQSTSRPSTTKTKAKTKTRTQDPKRCALRPDSLPFGAHLYMGMLAVRRGRFKDSLRHWARLHNATPRHFADFYHAYALLRLQRKRKAAKVLGRWTQPSRWVGVVTHLQALLSDKALSSKTKKEMKKLGYWWSVMGPLGLQANETRSLQRLSLTWRIHRHLWMPRASKASQQEQRARADIWAFFRSIHPSDFRGRFSLLSLMTRYRWLIRHHSLQGNLEQVKRYQERWRKLRQLFAAYPTQHYLLERSYYTHYLGIMALGLF